MSLREQHEERERQWRLFHEWEEDNLAPKRTASAVLADLSFLLTYVPAEELGHDPDPNKLGIANMRAALARLES